MLPIDGAVDVDIAGATSKVFDVNPVPNDRSRHFACTEEQIDVRLKAKPMVETIELPEQADPHERGLMWHEDGPQGMPPERVLDRSDRAQLPAIAIYHPRQAERPVPAVLGIRGDGVAEHPCSGIGVARIEERDERALRERRPLVHRVIDAAIWLRDDDGVREHAVLCQPFDRSVRGTTVNDDVLDVVEVLGCKALEGATQARCVIPRDRDYRHSRHASRH